MRMLIDLDTMQPIQRIPYQQEFDTMRQRLTTDEFDAIIAEVNRRIDNAGGEIATAGWLPGSNWADTPFWPIYESAARHNQELAGKLFGLLVWYAVMERPEHWASGRYQKDGRDIGSRTYFRIDPPR
jgi:hypothetical protein